VSGFEGVSVLVADYDRWTRLSVTSMLTTAGFSVQEASNGMSALRMARAGAPDVVMLGPELPEIATDDLVHLLRSDSRTRDVAVVPLPLRYTPIELVAAIVGAVDKRRSRPTVTLEPHYAFAATAAPTRSVSASLLGM
jgi:CheY-like chemotaxis protein